MKAIQFILAIFVALLLSACGGGGGASNSGSTTGATLISISITPATISISIPMGLTQQYTAHASYSDGTTQTITGVAYASSNTAVASIVVGTEGSVIANSVGTTTITATYQGKIALATLSVTAATLQSISISPATASIPISATQQFTATGNYSDGTTLPITTASWSSSSPSSANIDSSGLASSLATGNSIISVVSGGKTASASLDVTSATLLSITVTSASANIVSGNTQQYSATGNYSDGTTKVINNPTWASSLTSVATINLAGVATAGMGGGSTNISATYAGISASVPLTVTLATPVSLTIATNYGWPTTLPLNTTQISLSARINYSNAPSQPVSANAVWSSSNTAVGTISGAFLGTAGVSPVGVGSTTVTVTDAGLSGTIVITYTAPVASSSSIVGLNLTTKTFAKRTSVQLTAKISYTNGLKPAISSTWSSSDTNVFTVDSTGLFAGVGPGTATLTSTADGFVTTRNITIVNPVATPSIVVTCNPVAPMTISAAAWNAGFALDPTNASEWVTVDPVSCAANPYIVLVATTPSTNQYGILEAPRYSASVVGPAITYDSTMTPQLSSGTKVSVGYKTVSPSFFYTSIYSITAAP